MTTSLHDTTTAPVPMLRAATRDDLAAVRRLLADCDLPDAGVDALFAEHASDFVIAEAPDAEGRTQLVGVAGLEVCCDDALLRSVAVRPEWRAHGVGRALVRRLVCRAEERGLRALYLLTMTAEHYFPRFGFETVERGVVPAAIADTMEFRSACPASAVAMARPLHA
jgi:amino-acid N-acetyltransferase